MFIDESFWIREKLSKIDLPPGSEVLNIGSSDENFLVTQPHIGENVLAPLRERGARIVNLDIRPSRPGDYSADITDRELPGKVGRRFRLIMCTSLLEHVTDRDAAFSNIAALAEDAGYILLTVPRYYPRHLDPIDTMYRPSADELAEEINLRRPAEVVAAEVLDIKARHHYFYRSRIPLWGYRKLIFWRRWFYGFRWKMSCALLRVGKS
jgi:SAM-dependent methyltransferase